jgi:hypothetical protein
MGGSNVTITIWHSRAWLVLALAAVDAISAVPKVNDRLGQFFDGVNERLTHGQKLIDTAEARSKDVTALHRRWTLSVHK